MGTNIIKALINIDDIKTNKVSEIYKSKNKINSVGDALEYYIKDVFCGTFNLNGIEEKDREHLNYLSYLGTQNQPPDFIIKNGAAVEVKKITSQGSKIILNSSYPKNKLYSDDSKINEECRNCEEEKWEEKDIIYIIGCVKEGKLKLLWLIYGDCYAASRENYEDIYNLIKDVVDNSPYETSETNELGKLKKIDPLGITMLRVRGMFHINNPLKVYDYLSLIDYNIDNDLKIYSIIRETKYNDFSNEGKNDLVQETSDFMNIYDIEIKNPDDPDKFIDAKLIKGVYNF